MWRAAIFTAVFVYRLRLGDENELLVNAAPIPEITAAKSGETIFFWHLLKGQIGHVLFQGRVLICELKTILNPAGLQWCLCTITVDVRHTVSLFYYIYCKTHANFANHLYILLKC